MAKFYGQVGYVETVETPGSVWVEKATEYPYRGDVVRLARTLREGENKVNSDISVRNSLSIVADKYAFEHFFAIRYVKWMGVYWTVDEVEVQHPRLLLDLGGVYNGPKPETP